MGRAEVIMSILVERGTLLCDDCLSEITGITPRQNARDIALKLTAAGQLRRDEFGTCGKCRRDKHCTYAPGRRPKPS